MSRIQYITGDATQPDAEGNKIIVHVCNDIGGWGKGFVLALSKRWNNQNRNIVVGTGTVPMSLLNWGRCSSCPSSPACG